MVTSQDFWVKPRSADINENVLSESAKEELGLSEELIRTKGASLENVLIQVKTKYVTSSSTGAHHRCGYHHFLLELLERANDRQIEQG